MRTIRARIAIWAFGLLLGVLLLESALVLSGLDRALQAVADRELRADLGELAAEVVDGNLDDLLATVVDPTTNRGDLVFEIRDYLERRARFRGADLLYVLERRGGGVVAASAALGDSRFSDGGPEMDASSRLRFRTTLDPVRSDPGVSLRVAELPIGPFNLSLARNLESFAAIRAATRNHLLVVLAAVTSLGALGAYAIAHRALSPLRVLAREARRLRNLSEGSLSMAGRGDEVDELTQVLNELFERVRADVVRIRHFTADAAHEIRTPLAAIRGHLELLLTRVGPAEQTTVGELLEEVQRLGRLVNHLLLLEKLEETPNLEEGRALDLAQLARELLDHVGILAEDRGVRLQGEFEAAPVRGDPERLRQMLLNLLDNALRFTPEGGVIGLAVSRRGETVRAVVHNSGEGIAPGDCERIFERFASDRGHRAAGTGLGLPIARAIARAHGGELTVTSPERAEFRCELPAAPPRGPRPAPGRG